VTKSVFLTCNGFTSKLTRSGRRKTVAIKIVAGEIFVIAPSGLPLADIERLLIKKSAWIAEKVALQQQMAMVKPKQFVAGESFLYLGQTLSLRIAHHHKANCASVGEVLLVSVPNPKIDNRELVKRFVINWYKNQAASQLQHRTAVYAKLIGVTPASLQVKSFKARWGSCSHKGDIHYNWRLIGAPEFVIDYVVVHELCHLLQHNHSPVFWQLVRQFMPNYLTAKEWLKMNARLLEF
jgi:predicted metal-dependent hydrolase